MRIASCLALLFAALSLHAQTTYVLKAARLFDGKSDSLAQPGVVVISGNKIQSVGGQIPSTATVIDLGDATLLPGFIDAHTHQTMDFNPDYNGARLVGLSFIIE
jgi:imidazolonepropionase-like amidohydrolase